MKTILRDRLLRRRPVILSKAEYRDAWNGQYNIWAPENPGANRFACDACKGAACNGVVPCDRCASTGYISRKDVDASYKAYYVMARISLAAAVAVEQRFERFLKSTNIDDIRLAADLFGTGGAYINMAPPKRRAPNKSEKALLKK
jgi:hypothetical protein